MDKVYKELRGRKFWALVIALTGIWTGVYVNALSVPEAINASVAALAGYMIGTGAEASAQASK